MRISLFSLAVGVVGLGTAFAAAAQPPAPRSVEELWQIVQRQQAEIDSLRQQLVATTQRAAVTDQRLEETAQQVVATDAAIDKLGPAERATTVGGYGEVHHTRLDADDAANDVDAVDYHRFVLFFGHRFNDRIRLASEVEIEHAVAGDGEAGEVELEQAYLDFDLKRDLTARAGLFLVPAGILNETHEPPTFYGVERNDVENVLVPTSWREVGFGLSGRLSERLSWDAAVHSGLAMPTTGANAFRVRSGTQEAAEALASDLAYTFRLRYRVSRDLEVAGTYQYQSDPSQVAGDGLDSGRLFTAHALYKRGDFALRALYASWAFAGAAVDAAGVDDQSGWYVEPSYKLSDRWGIYARVEDVAGARLLDRFQQWEAGFNYWPIPRVVVKFDYRSRQHDLGALSGRDFGAIDIGLGYQF